MAGTAAGALITKAKVLKENPNFYREMRIKKSKERLCHKPGASLCGREKGRKY